MKFYQHHITTRMRVLERIRFLFGKERLFQIGYQETLLITFFFKQMQRQKKFWND